ncbi:MAG: hypothetical protein ACNA78_10620 [Balneolaceae bacterium]
MNTDEWAGRSANRRDHLAPEQLQKFEAMLNRQPDSVSVGTELSACAHWAYFPNVHTHSSLTVQGYPREEGFLPDIPLSTRLWLGGRLSFKKPLVAGTPADQHSTILAFEKKTVDESDRYFLQIQHQISTKGALAISEDQHFMYRSPTEKGAHPTRTEPMDIDPDWEHTTRPDSVLLFRFSALTFNAHRIHYDQEYAREVEGYPNCMVHGPLLLLLALEAFRSQFDGRYLEEVEYHLPGPVYLGEQMTISGKSVDNHRSELRITGPEKKVALKASVKWGYSW